MNKCIACGRAQAECNTAQNLLDQSCCSHCCHEAKPLVGKNHPETSKAAARKAEPTYTSKLATISRVIRESDSGLADFEIEEITGWLHETVSSQRGNLVKKGVIEYAGFTRIRPSSGNACKVWRFVE